MIMRLGIEIPWLISDGKAQPSKPPAAVTKNRLRLLCTIKGCPSKATQTRWFVKASTTPEAVQPSRRQGTDRSNFCYCQTDLYSLTIMTLNMS